MKTETESKNGTDAVGKPGGLAAASGSPTPRTDDFILYAVRTDHNWRTFARQLERELAAARKALMICEGAMMGKVNPKSVAFKAVGAILRPENAAAQASPLTLDSTNK